MYGINAEYKNSLGKYPLFFEHIKGKKVFAVSDINTDKYMRDFLPHILPFACEVKKLVFEDRELIADEKACREIIGQSDGFDYIFTAGSGTLNDLGKYASFKNNIKCGILASAPSMDGYTSGVSALVLGGKKITLNTKAPDDVLIDCDILASAPDIMIGAGVGDVLGKYTCLLDWKMAHLKNGESYNQKAVDMMKIALNACTDNIQKILTKTPQGMKYLIDALIASGYAMVTAGNSRPASGGEHHTSHYLEMWFVKNRLPVPLHGIKVGLGTMVCIWLYNYILENNISFDNCQLIYQEIKTLPKIEYIENILKKMNCPCRYSEIGVSGELLKEMLLNAYTVRERYTVLTLFDELGLMDKVCDSLIQRFL